jgi:hypothetical protein
VAITHYVDVMTTRRSTARVAPAHPPAARTRCDGGDLHRAMRFTLSAKGMRTPIGVFRMKSFPVRPGFNEFLGSRIRSTAAIWLDTPALRQLHGRSHT